MNLDTCKVDHINLFKIYKWNVDLSFPFPMQNIDIETTSYMINHITQYLYYY